MGPLWVQRMRLDTTLCWKTTHTTLQLNDGVTVKAKSD